MRPDEPCVHERDETGPLARFFYNTGLPCVECEREAHDAWIEGVRARLEEALFHVAHSLPALPLDQYPCAKHPHCDQILGGGWGDPYGRFRVVENPDGTVTAYGRLS